jgi:hypothetical protein
MRRSSCIELGEVVEVAVQALAARHDLDAAVQEVEAARPLRPVRVRMRVKRPLPRGVALDEDELAVLAADPAFVVRRKVRFRSGPHVLEAQDRDRARQLEPDSREHGGDTRLDHRHHISMVVDETELGVE